MPPKRRPLFYCSKRQCSLLSMPERIRFDMGCVIHSWTQGNISIGLPSSEKGFHTRDDNPDAPGLGASQVGGTAGVVAGIGSCGASNGEDAFRWNHMALGIPFDHATAQVLPPATKHSKDITLFIPKCCIWANVRGITFTLSVPWHEASCEQRMHWKGVP